MGIYFGEYEQPCPRCGTGRVGTCFISVSPMSFSEHCGTCGAENFTDEERERLGGQRAADWPRWSPGIVTGTTA